MRHIRFLMLFFVALTRLTTPLLAQSNQALFAPVLTYGSGGQYASSVAIGDVNGDGKLDLLVANQCPSSSCGGSIGVEGTVGVLLGNGDGTFRTATTYNSGARSSRSIAVADVNGDNKLDLLVESQCATGYLLCRNGIASVLLGYGDGRFGTAVTYDTGAQGGVSIMVRDVSNDGVPDLVVTNGTAPNGGYGGSVAVLLGKGDGSFQAAVLYSSGGDPAQSAAVADVNGDGKPDLVVGNLCVVNVLCSSVGILLGIGDGTFEPVTTYAAGGGEVSVAVADVNGDAKPDLLVSNQCAVIDCLSAEGSVGVLLGNGDGTFQPEVTYSSGAIAPYFIATGDINADGALDLVIANICAEASCSGNGTVSVLLGNGDGSFQTPLTYDSGGAVAWSVAVADLNSDGKLDIVLANDWVSRENLNGTVGVLINNTPSPYKALIQQPINSDGTSTFKANRGVIPVKFALTQNNAPTCALPSATISLTQTAGATLGSIDESTYYANADSGSHFRIADCQYIYNLPVSGANLGAGRYSVDIKINGSVVGNAVFALK